MPSQYVNLMPEDQDLGCQRRSRSEQPDQHRPNKAAGFLHRTERLRDSASVVSPIEFTTGTRFEQRWAARFLLPIASAAPQKHRPERQSEQLAASSKGKRKTRR